MESSVVDFESEKKKTRKSTPTKLVDGTVCYTIAVRYPNYILDALRRLCYEKKFENMSETIFYCIEGHRNRKFLSAKNIEFTKKDVTALTIRFRETHYDYIQKVCKTKRLKTFSSGVIHVVYEYLKAEERL